MKRLLALLSIAVSPLNFGCAQAPSASNAPPKSLVSKQGKSNITYRDGKVIAGTQLPSFYPLNVHGGESTFLIVLGKRYNRVRGEQPYYLTIPQLDSILFVTEKGADRVTIHVVNLRTKKDMRLDPINETFGHHIGAGKESAYLDWLERLEDDVLVLGSSGPKLRLLYYFRLRQRKLEKIEQLDLDITGAVIKKTVFDRESLK